MFSWSTLAKIAQSKIVQITAFVPFFGFLILFNQNVVDTLLVSASIAVNLEGLNINTLPKNIISIMTQQLTVTRLYYIYFGSLFLGIATIGFRVTCPQLIKNYQSETEFVAAERQTFSEPRLHTALADVAFIYAMYMGFSSGTTHSSDGRDTIKANSLPKIIQLHTHKKLMIDFGRFIEHIARIMTGVNRIESDAYYREHWNIILPIIQRNSYTNHDIGNILNHLTNFIPDVMTFEYKYKNHKNKMLRIVLVV